MGSWKIGNTELLSAAWYVNNTEVVVGSATVSISLVASGVVNYLSSNLSTLTTTPTELSLTYDTITKWSRLLTVPSSMEGHNVYIVYTHSDTTLPRLSDEVYYVTENDLDDIIDDGAHVGE